MWPGVGGRGLVRGAGGEEGAQVSAGGAGAAARGGAGGGAARRAGAGAAAEPPSATGQGDVSRWVPLKASCSRAWSCTNSNSGRRRATCVNGLRKTQRAAYNKHPVHPWAVCMCSVSAGAAFCLS